MTRALFNFPDELLRVNPHNKRSAGSLRLQIRNEHDLGLMKGTLLIAFSIAALTLAAICTVLLNLTTRRATLRQINASLLEISDQLKELRSSATRHPA
jgi:hypothetical protein